MWQVVEIYRGQVVSRGTAADEVVKSKTRYWAARIIVATDTLIVARGTLVELVIYWREP